MRDAFLLLILIVTLPFIVLYPHVGVLVWSWISYYNPHRLAYGFMTDTPLLVYIGGLTLVAWLFSREPKLPPNHPVVWGILIFFLWTCITTIAAQDFDLALDKFNIFFKIILFTILSVAVINARHRLEHLMLIICLSLGYFALKGAVGTIIAGGENSFTGPPGTFLDDRNSLSLAFVMNIPMLRYLQIHSDKRIVRIAAAAGIPLNIMAVIGSQSRGSFIALLICGAWMVWRTRRRFVVFITVGVFLVSGVAFMPQGWRDRITGVTTAAQDDGSAIGRLQMWRYALDLAQDHPVLGGGFETFKNRSLAGHYIPPWIKLRASHSIYFQAIGEHGLVGLFLFLYIWMAAIIGTGDIVKSTRGQPPLLWANDLAATLQASLVGFIVGGAFLPLIVYDLAYQIAGMVVILSAIVRQQQVKSMPQSATPWLVSTKTPTAMPGQLAARS